MLKKCNLGIIIMYFVIVLINWSQCHLKQTSYIVALEYTVNKVIFGK